MKNLTFTQYLFKAANMGIIYGVMLLVLIICIIGIATAPYQNEEAPYWWGIVFAIAVSIGGTYHYYEKWKREQ